MRVSKDCRALESLPLKLIIVAIIAALSVVPAADALESLRNRGLFQRAESQMDRIATAAESMAIAGPGNVRTLGIDLTSDGSLRFSSMAIGDRLNGSNASAIVLVLSNGARLVRTLTSPPVAMSSLEGGMLEIRVPCFQLRMSAVAAESGWHIVVEVR